MSLSIESRCIHLEGDDPDPERRLSGGTIAIRSLKRYNVALALMKIQAQRPCVESLAKGDLRWTAAL